MGVLRQEGVRSLLAGKLLENPSSWESELTLSVVSGKPESCPGAFFNKENSFFKSCAFSVNHVILM